MLYDSQRKYGNYFKEWKSNFIMLKRGERWRWRIIIIIIYFISLGIEILYTWYSHVVKLFSLHFHSFRFVRIITDEGIERKMLFKYIKNYSHLNLYTRNGKELPRWILFWRVAEKFSFTFVPFHLIQSLIGFQFILTD